MTDLHCAGGVHRLNLQRRQAKSSQLRLRQAPGRPGCPYGPGMGGKIGRSLDWNRRMPTAEVALRISILNADTANGTRIRDLFFARMSARKDENAEGMLESCGVGRLSMGSSAGIRAELASLAKA